MTLQPLQITKPEFTACSHEDELLSLFREVLLGTIPDFKLTTVLRLGVEVGDVAQSLFDGGTVYHASNIEALINGKLNGAGAPQPHLAASINEQLSEIDQLSFDAIVSLEDLIFISPTKLHHVFSWFYNHVKAGGYCLLSSSTFLSRDGAALSSILKTPFAHLLFPKRVIEDYLRNSGKSPPRYVNPLCAASYLTLSRRIGFEIVAANRLAEELVDLSVKEMGDKLHIYDSDELQTKKLYLLMRKPTSEWTIDPSESRSTVARGTRQANDWLPVTKSFDSRPEVEAKSTQTWGANQAQNLWRQLYSRYSPTIDGRTVLDLGCSWGYMLKFLADEFHPGKLIGTDIKPWWKLKEHGWRYTELKDLIEFHSGDLTDIVDIERQSVDLILCTSVLQYMTPEQAEANLARAYELLRPGGEMLLRTRVFTSYVGADLHRDIDLPYVHLLYGERDIARYMKEQRGKQPPYLNWLTASTYLAVFVRVGFEVLDVRRRMNKAAPEIMERVISSFPSVARNELLCAEVEARLLKPFEPEELDDLAPNLTTGNRKVVKS